MKELVEYIKKENIGKLIENISTSKLTTYRVGGNARLLVFPKGIEELVSLLKYVKSLNIKYKVIGYGSNLLFSDSDYDGLLINLKEFDWLEFHNKKITVGAGYSLMKLAIFSAKKSLTGLEFASGIPGSVGGAVFMNAGAYGSDMGYVVERVKVLTPDLKIINLVNKEMNFHYRTSFLKENSGFICLEATIKLKAGKKEAIEEVNRERKIRRISSQPLEYPSAGSVFRNPSSDVFAGKLIEDLGFKGLTKGGAQVSNKHANFIINRDNAKASDIKELISFVKETVLDKYKIELKEEQEYVNWDE